MTIQKLLLSLLLLEFTAALAFTQEKPKVTLDEFFNSVSYPSVELSPEGNSVVLVSERADWDQQIFRNDLWLYRDDAKGGSLIQLTQSGHDTAPKWSPDGRWIAFLSERKTSSDKNSDSEDDKGKKDKDDDKGDVSQLYLISPGHPTRALSTLPRATRGRSPTETITKKNGKMSCNTAPPSAATQFSPWM
jgi:dipeptidyl aminopeptidase/acylaminoacyl peptidase